ncbi:WG repeat-containing protein [Ekhidna sp.]
MRNLIFTLFFLISFVANADQFTVFEKDGYFGIKDETGNVTVPAVYEKLGWSDGSSKVFNGVIGYKRDNLWGLITVRNKSLTGQKFYTIVPISANYFKASIKGRFSNRLFHGILDEKGKTIISFNYFSIDPLGANWLVSDFDGIRQQFGVASFENKLVIPTKYVGVVEENSLLVASQGGGKIDIYRPTGKQLQLDVDSLSYNDGWILYRDGYAGSLDNSGAVVYDFEYKDIKFDGSELRAHAFPKWSIYKKDELLLEWRCDSIAVGENGWLIAYLNGAHHLLLENETLLNNHELILKEVSGSQMIVQNSKTRMWQILDEKGMQVIGGYDSIHSIGGHYGCLDDKGWHLVNNEGDKENRLPLQDLRQGAKGQFLVKRNGHWGILNISEKGMVTYKYDSIFPSGKDYIVSYLNRWGVLNSEQTWVIRSEYNEIIPMGKLLFGRRGLGYSVHNQENFLYKTISKPVSELDSYILMQGDSAKYGLLNSFGEQIVMPEYDTIRLWSGHLELMKDGYVVLINETGKKILKPEEFYQEVKGFDEDYFVVKKEGRYGFVDLQGRLRISNRYDNARPFHEGLAPIKLRGKWGFINKEEQIKIQPYYQHVTAFKDGRAIVKLGDKYGLIDENGNEVLELNWKSILRLETGSYLVQDIDERYGLVDASGGFIFRPSFDNLEDFGDKVLVSKNGAMGILNYARHPIFKVSYEEVRVNGDFTMIKE